MFFLILVWVKFFYSFRSMRKVLLLWNHDRSYLHVISPLRELEIVFLCISLNTRLMEKFFWYYRTSGGQYNLYRVWVNIQIQIWTSYKLALCYTRSVRCPLGCNAVRLVGRYRHFGGTYFLHLRVWSFDIQPWRWRQYVPPKCRYLPTSPHGVTTQKTNTDIFTTVIKSVL
jgi:hypothetical protein